jgi:hypothetical protein
MSSLPALLSDGVRRLLDDMLAYSASDRPTARQVADRAHEIAEQTPGPSMRSWARSFPWPKEDGAVGAWTGKRVTETTMVSEVSHNSGVTALDFDEDAIRNMLCNVHPA